jgi:hypothetical protein
MDPAIAQVLAKGYRNETDLSTADLLILDSYVQAWMSLYQQDYLEYREGLQPEEWLANVNCFFRRVASWKNVTSPGE